MHLFQPGEKEYKARIWFAVLPVVIMLAGCGKNQMYEEKEEQGREQQAEEMPELSEEELSAMLYVEKIEVKDDYGDGASYDAYAPRGSENEFYFGHGITYFASAYKDDSTSYLYEYMEDMVEFTVEDWQDEAFGDADDVKLGKVMENGDDRYQFASATKKNVFEGTTFEVRAVFYLDVQEEGGGVLWSMELEEGNTDEETEFILEEIAACYRVDLDELKTAAGEWFAAEREYAESRQDIYEPEAGDLVLEEVEGYQYMGVMTLTAGDGETKCPVMAPRGFGVSARDNYVSSYMHGVSVNGRLGLIAAQSFMKDAESDIDISYGSYQKDTDTYRNVQKTNMMPISGYEEALYAVITCEELDSYTQEYVSCVRVRCFIKISDDYMLDYDIKLSYDEYDSSTNTVIKELETAYGIDLSKYYYEEEN